MARPKPETDDLRKFGKEFQLELGSTPPGLSTKGRKVSTTGENPSKRDEKPLVTSLPESSTPGEATSTINKPMTKPVSKLNPEAAEFKPSPPQPYGPAAYSTPQYAFTPQRKFVTLSYVFARWLDYFPNHATCSPWR